MPTYRLNEVFKAQHTIKADSLHEAISLMVSLRDDVVEFTFDHVELVEIDGKPNWRLWYAKPENISVEDTDCDR